MEKKEMKIVTVWRVGIQGGKAQGYGWAWSPEFPSIDAIWKAYEKWFAANPMRSIKFRREFKYIPE